MSGMRWAIDQLNPALRQQAEQKLARLRVVSTERTVIVRGDDDARVVNWKRAKSKHRKPLLPKLSEPEQRLAFHLRVEDLGHFVLGHRFHPVRKWRIDVAFVAERLAIEIEGVTREGGRHQRIKGFRNDMKKYNELMLAGWRLLRFMPEMVSSGHAVFTIKRALSKTNEEGRHASDGGQNYNHEQRLRG